VALAQRALTRNGTWDGGNFTAQVLRWVDRWYVVVVVAMWTLMPEARRLVDWQMGYNSLAIIALLPTLSLVPSLFALFSRNGKPVPASVSLTAWLFVGAFAYAFVVAVALNNLISGTYELVEYLLPLTFAIWLLRSTGLTAEENIARLSTGLLILGGLSALYGLVQYAAPPAWDVVWVQNSNLVSIGTPVPFGLRIFGTLNAPGPYADVLIAALLLNLRFVQAGQWWRILLMTPIIAALGLSLVRADWVALILGIGVYIVLSPGRKKILVPLIFITAISTGVLLNLNTLFGSSSDATQQVSDRLSTFGNLQEDTSAQARGDIFSYTWNTFIAEPFGQGLGVVGTSTKLGKGQETVSFDNGFLARLFEMGIIGFPLYMATLGMALVVTLRAWLRAQRAGDRRIMEIMTASIAFQFALIVLDSAGDHHGGFIGCLFWAVFVLSLQLGSKASSPVTQG